MGRGQLGSGGAGRRAATAALEVQGAARAGGGLKCCGGAPRSRAARSALVSSTHVLSDMPGTERSAAQGAQDLIAE